MAHAVIELPEHENLMRQEFSKHTKALAFQRAKGKCEGCGFILRPGKFHYDHIKACEFGGQATLDNCKVLCIECHGEKTSKQDVPAIAKSNRIRARAAGHQKPRTITRWRKFNGQPVFAERERG